MLVNPREFVYVGESAPQIKTSGNTDFIIHFQKAMLLSLVKRNLLTSEQMDCVMSKIEKQYRKAKQ
jgi:hypothetical protein